MCLNIVQTIHSAFFSSLDKFGMSISMEESFVVFQYKIFCFSIVSLMHRPLITTIWCWSSLVSTLSPLQVYSILLSIVLTSVSNKCHVCTLDVLGHWVFKKFSGTKWFITQTHSITCHFLRLINKNNNLMVIRTRYLIARIHYVTLIHVPCQGNKC